MARFVSFHLSVRYVLLLADWNFFVSSVLFGTKCFGVVIFSFRLIGQTDRNARTKSKMIVMRPLYMRVFECAHIFRNANNNNNKRVQLLYLFSDAFELRLGVI